MTAPQDLYIIFFNKITNLLKQNLNFYNLGSDAVEIQSGL